MECGMYTVGKNILNTRLSHMYSQVCTKDDILSMYIYNS